MGKSETIRGHLLAAFTVLIWGSTFIASKVLLGAFTPIQVMVMRFLVAYIALWCIHPKWHFKLKDELGFLLLSLFSCTLYFLCENGALTYTLSSNVSIILSAAPLFTALLASLFYREERLSRYTFWGFLAAFVGVALVVFNGAVVLKLNPMGDSLALGAALLWACYSVLQRRFIGRFPSVLLSRKLMFYGLVSSLPILLIQGDSFPIAYLWAADKLIALAFLGLLGSALCYVSWNEAFRRIGIVKTNNYIYVSPFVTMVAAALILKEPITAMGLTGAVCIIAGVVISSRKPRKQSGAPYRPPDPPPSICRPGQ